MNPGKDGFYSRSGAVLRDAAVLTLLGWFLLIAAGLCFGIGDQFVPFSVMGFIMAVVLPAWGALKILVLLRTDPGTAEGAPRAPQLAKALYWLLALPLGISAFGLVAGLYIVRNL
jgi:hypothetical protein